MRKATRHIPVILVALLIMVLSLSDPGEGSRSLLKRLSFKNADKAVHLLMYFGFALMVFWFYRRKAVKMSDLLIQAFFVIFYGVLMEILQSSVTTTRQFDVFDILANFSGVLLALALFLIYNKYQPKKGL